MKCNHCGAEAGDKLTCVYCGARTNYQYVPYNDATVINKMQKIDDVPNIFMILLAFLIPLFGIIYYFVNVSKVQTKSRAYGIASLVNVIGTIVVFTVMILGFIL